MRKYKYILYYPKRNKYQDIIGNHRKYFNDINEAYHYVEPDIPFDIIDEKGKRILSEDTSDEEAEKLGVKIN